MKTSELTGAALDRAVMKWGCQMSLPEIYAIEWNGDCYQSVFPSAEAELSQLHTSVQDALDYFAEVKPGVIVEIPEELK